jgi:hypothetical protein
MDVRACRCRWMSGADIQQACDAKSRTKRKPRRSGALQTVSLTSFSPRHPGRNPYVSVLCFMRFLRYVHVK